MKIPSNLTFIRINLWLVLHILFYFRPCYGHRSSSIHRYEIRLLDEEQCERIRIPVCTEVGYNFTNIKLSPSNMGSQDDTVATVEQFSLLIDTRCAEEMRLLVCSIYTPICLPSYPKFLPPCRHICERAKEGCGPLLAQYNLPWPELLQCDLYPEYSGDNQLCLHSNQSLTSSPAPDSDSFRLQNATRSNSLNIFVESTKSDINISSSKIPCKCTSPLILMQDDQDPLFDKVKTGSIKNCLLPCKNFYHSPRETEFFFIWIASSSIACFIVTLLTVGTFLIDVERFKYPERPVVFISACYLFVSMGFLLRLFAGHEAVACGWRSDRISYQSTGPFLCSTVFLLTYYFGMAGSLWWVILTLTWFMAAGLKWGNEAICVRSKYFHMVAWLIPGLQSIVVLATASVDGDPLTGLCYVGNQNTVNLNRFVIAPLTMYMGLGGLFLLLGFTNMIRIRSSMKNVGGVTQALDKLIGRIGFYSLIYMTLSASLVVCLFYENLSRNKWLDAYNCTHGDQGKIAKPSLMMSLVKHSVSLFIGIANGWWVCSKKTLRSWKVFYRQSCLSACDSNGVAAWLKQTRNKRKVKKSPIVKKKKASDPDASSLPFTSSRNDATIKMC